MNAIKKINHGEFWGDGFKIRLSRETISYFEDDKYMEISTESFANKNKIAIYFGEALYWSHQGKPSQLTTEAERDIIKTRIGMVMDMNKTEYQFE